MRMMNLLVFDETLTMNTNGIFYTSSEFDSILGKYDQLAVQLTYENLRVVGSGSVSGLSLGFVQSCDGEHFVPTTQLFSTSTLLSGEQALFGANAGSSPNYGLVRLVLILLITPPVTSASLSVKIYVTAREQGGVLLQGKVAPRPKPLTRSETAYCANNKWPMTTDAQIIACRNRYDYMMQVHANDTRKHDPSID